MDILTKRINAKLINILAISLWVASLATIVASNGIDTVIGLEVLIFGWLGIPWITLGWLSNILFCFLTVQIQTFNKSNLIIALISIALACLSYKNGTYVKYSTHSGAIYGYGIGFILWILAHITQLIAVALHRIEYSFKEKHKKASFFPLFFALALLLFTVISFSFLIFDDELNSNYDERARFKATNTLFRRGEVCSEEYYTPSNTYNLDSSLRVSGNKSSIIDSPNILLENGIPKVTFGSYDIIARGDDYETMLIATVNTEKPKFHLKQKQSSKSVAQKLTISTNNNVFYEQIWRPDSNPKRYCPRFFHSKYSKTGLERVLADAFNIKPTPFSYHKHRSLKATIIREINIESFYIDERKVKSDNNLYCEEEVGLLSEKERMLLKKRIKPWRHVPKGYKYRKNIYLGKRIVGSHLVCGDKFVYLYYIILKDKELIFYLAKRIKNDFQLISENKWIFSYGYESLKKDIKLISLTKIENEIEISLLDEVNKNLISFKIELNELKTYSN